MVKKGIRLLVHEKESKKVKMRWCGSVKLC